MGLFKAPTPPTPPDPRQIAQAQGQANIESALATALLNQINTVGPTGTVTFEQTGTQNIGGNEIPSFTRTTQLTPEAQAQFEAEQALGNALTGLAQGQVGRIEGALGQGIDTTQLPALTSIPETDLGAQAQALEQATFDRALNLLRPEFERQQQDVDVSISERGLPISSAAAARIRDPFTERRERTLQDLALGAVGAGRQEQSRLFSLDQARAAIANAARAQGFQEQAFTRSIPISDIAALLGTSPAIQAPQFQQTPAVGVNAPDIIGAELGVSNLLNQQFAAQQQARGGLLGGLFNLGGSLGAASINKFF